MREPPAKRDRKKTMPGLPLDLVAEGLHCRLMSLSGRIRVCPWLGASHNPITQSNNEQKEFVRLSICSFFVDFRKKDIRVRMHVLAAARVPRTSGKGQCLKWRQ